MTLTLKLFGSLLAVGATTTAIAVPIVTASSTSTSSGNVNKTSDSEDCKEILKDEAQKEDEGKLMVCFSKVGENVSFWWLDKSDSQLKEVKKLNSLGYSLRVELNLGNFGVSRDLIVVPQDKYFSGGAYVIFPKSTEIDPSKCTVKGELKNWTLDCSKQKI
ncbi:hypothetical protein OVS_04160 [Mycoplasma ovis str. Michigan]|uniref:Uncharacterized protein n=1 Tax=Mycoplasma ovis str. Michigan TaxID=1415773 RepID=A0ABM5P264_9MOLU|nr:hypothetical protein [Mycoplasma ovis]AHC40559.1 hypothetical protein OVS_04160 [Mycoplasma ovis str. Michigan]